MIFFLFLFQIFSNLLDFSGSAKAHERGGCLLCDSKHFCEPQDFDYQCPCDWHRSERTRQALSFEANIRRYEFRKENKHFITEKLANYNVSILVLRSSKSAIFGFWTICLPKIK